MVETWLVTGATGLLGANAGVFLHEQVRVVGACRHPRPLFGYDSVEGVDLFDVGSVVEMVERVRPRVVLHAAALASHEGCERDPELAYASNVTATETVARASEMVGASLIYVSTDAVFDGSKGRYSEEDSASPFSVYGTTKLMGEELALRFSSDCIVARTNFFGWSPDGHRSILEFFVNSLRSQTLVNGYTDFFVSSIYVQHLMGLLTGVVAGPHRGIVHAAAAQGCSKYDFGISVAREFDLPDSLILPVESAAGDHLTRRDRDISLDTSLIEQWLGHAIPSQAEGVRAAAADEGRVTPLVRATD